MEEKDNIIDNLKVNNWYWNDDIVYGSPDDMITAETSDSLISGVSIIDTGIINNSFSSRVNVTNINAALSFPAPSYTNSNTIITAGVNGKAHMNLDILATEECNPGDVLVIGEDGKPKWGMIDISLEKTLANPALRGALDKLIEAYNQYKMLEKLSENENNGE